MAYFVVFSTAADQSAIGNGDEMSAPSITTKQLNDIPLGRSGFWR
jgi:hypothetical protein